MKRFGLLIITILLPLTLVHAQANKPKLDMVFDQTVDGLTSHDFGSIVYGANGKVDFTFANNSNKPLIISDVKSSCGCTVPTWTKEPVAPGKTGVVTVVYNTTLPGVFNKTVEVYSNANNSPIRIGIRGKVNSQPSDLQPKPMDGKSKTAAAVIEEGESGVLMDSTAKAKKAQVNNAQLKAQQEAFKKLMEQDGQKANKPKVGTPVTVTEPPANQKVTPPVKK